MTTKVKYIADNVVTVDQIDLSTLSTSNVSEGTNLYYTDARVDSRLSSGSVATISTSGDVTVGGNLTVNGTTTTINSTTLDIDDLNITLASGAANAAAADGAGITVDGASATLTYNSTPDAWSFNKSVGIGITSPSNTFHVYNTASADVGLIESTQTFSTLAFKSSTNTSTVTVGIDGAGNGAFENKLADGNLTFVTKNSLGTSGEAIRVKGDGKVGVGTTSPSTGLHSALGLRVSGASNQSELNSPTSPSANMGVYESGGTSYGFIDLASDAGSYGGWIDFSKSNGTDYGGRIRYDNSTDELDFYTNGSLTPAIKINSLGQLELNNPNAGQELIISTTSTSAGADPGIQILEPNSATVGAYIFLDTSAGTLLDLESPNGIAFNGSNGAEFARFTSAGNFGIGTASPSRHLEVTGTVAITNSSGIQYLLMGNQDSAGVNNPRIIASANGELNFGKGNNWSDTYGGTFSSQMLLTDDGKLGIGTSSPYAPLNVKSNTSGIEQFAIRISKNNYADTGGHTTFIGFGAETAAWSKGAIGFQRTASYDVGDFLFCLNSNAASGTDVSTTDERMRIKSNGNVGIRASNAPHDLTIHNASGPTLYLVGGSYNDDVRIAFGGGDTTNTSGNGNTGAQIISGQSAVNGQARGNLKFLTNGGDLLQERLRITEDGNVGIGQSSPTEKLHIGSGQSNYIRIHNAASGDVASGISITRGSNLGLSIYDNPTDNTSTFNAEGNINFRTSNQSFRLYIASGGNVGVGTSAPATKFHTVLGSDGSAFRVEGLTGNYWYSGSDSLGMYIEVASGTAASRRQLRIQANDGATTYTQYFVNGNSQSHSWTTSNTTRGYILSTGEWSIGSTDNQTLSSDFIHSIGTVNRAGLASSAYARLVMQERTGNWISFVNGTPVHFGTIAVSGSGVNYGSNSDYRLKENIVELPNAIDRVKLLSPKRFNFISAPEETRDGFLAHEVQEVVPEAVVGEKDGYIISGNVIDSEGNVLKENVTYPETLQEGTSWIETKREPKYQNLDNSHLVPLLTKALQEALEKIEALEARVQQLET